VSDETWDAWSRGYLEGQTCVCRQVTDEIRADERRRVLKELSDWTVGRYIDRMSLAIKLDEMRREGEQ
jgi:hypothetical protein